MSPALKQFHDFKSRHPGYVLLFKIGESYEMFHEDADTARTVMGVTVSDRSGVPVAAVPFNSVEVYLRKLIAAGHRCALCEPAA